jgi:hypothetical protein
MFWSVRAVFALKDGDEEDNTHRLHKYYERSRQALHYCLVLSFLYDTSPLKQGRRTSLACHKSNRLDTHRTETASQAKLLVHVAGVRRTTV